MKSKKVLNFVLIGVFCSLFLVFVLFLYNLVSSFYDGETKIVEKPVETENVLEVVKTPTPILDDENIKDEDFKHQDIYEEEQKEEKIINVLLVGMDARKSETKSRSDTIILVSYNKESHTVKMVSFMRDTWVHLYDRGWSKINAATAYGGVGLLINTINENFDLDIQNYVQIKFQDFKEVIDIIGGIDIELTKSEINYINNKLHTEDRDWKNDIKAEPGMVHLNGIQTLWHCRNRSIGNSDFTRTDRQREVLGILVDKCMNLSLSEFVTLVYSLKDYVDMNVPIDTILDIGYDALISKDITMESYRLPFDNMFGYANKNGASVIEINLEETTEKLHEILDYTDGKNEKLEKEVDIKDSEETE